MQEVVIYVEIDDETQHRRIGLVYSTRPHRFMERPVFGSFPHIYLPVGHMRSTACVCIRVYAVEYDFGPFTEVNNMLKSILLEDDRLLSFSFLEVPV